MDFSKLKTSDWLIGGGAVAFLIGMFLPWYTVKVTGFGSGSVNGTDYFLNGILPLLLIIAVFIALTLPALGVNVNIPDQIGPLPKARAALIAAAIAAGLVLIRLLVKDDEGADVLGVEVSRGIGLFLAFLASVAVVVGTLMKFKGTEDIRSLGGPGTGDQPPAAF